MAKKVIYLPNSEQAAQLMENAWQDFTVQMKENGMNFEGTKVAELLKDMFMAGYSYGHNDCLTYANLLGQKES